MGMCAEVGAASAMLTDGEKEIQMILAMMSDGSIGAPCGKCREFLAQMGGNPLVILSQDSGIYLNELLPYSWLDEKE